MRVALVAAVAAAIAVSVCAGVAGATTTRSACSLTSKTVKGHKASVYCGSATGSLHIGGTSYSFKGGSCLWAGGTLILDVGTQVNGATNNGGVPLFALSGETGFATFYADSGRLHIGMSLVKITAHGHSSGTFTGREPIGASRRFTGSYRC